MANVKQILFHSMGEYKTFKFLNILVYKNIENLVVKPPKFDDYPQNNRLLSDVG